jgi:hypothetical protein
MTTSVTIINHGPLDISVCPTDGTGATIEIERSTVTPTQTRTIHVWKVHGIRITEIDPTAPTTQQVGHGG